MNVQYHLHKIKFAYADKPVLNITQQTIAAGKITALLGANGAGKSTLLKLLAFILHTHTGNITFAGQAVEKKQFSTLRKQIGLVHQNPYLLNTNVRKNIELGLRFHGIKKTAREEKIQHILKLLKIEHLADLPAKSLSGGETQKIAIARALVLWPKVILLDEPFTYLDHNFTQQLNSLIRQLRDEDNRTIILTTHDRTHINEYSDQTLELINGQLTTVHQA